MSRLHSTRRLGLLAGTALIAASFSGAALAYDECTPANPPTTLSDGAGGVSDPTLNGAVADTFACSGNYAGGITYSSAGVLNVNSTGNMNVGATGINLTGNGADNVNFSATGTVTGTSGPAIDATSVTGDILLDVRGVTANAAGTTHAIRATSTGAGDITITRTASGGINNNVAGGLAAIEAVTNGGNVNLNIGPPTGAAGFAASGRQRGVLVQTSGSGSVVMSFNGQVAASTVDGVAAVDVTAGTGGISLTMTNGPINGGAGVAIRAVTPGTAVVTLTSGTVGNVNFNMPNGGGALDFSGVAGGATFNATGAGNYLGRWLGSGDTVFGGGNDTINLTGVGYNHLGGREGALADASIDFAGGNDTLNVAAFLSMGGFTSPTPGSIDFGTGTDTFALSGVFSSNGGTISNLEALNLSGTLILGAAPSFTSNPEVDWTRSNGSALDRLSVRGATLTGSGDARIMLDAYLDTSEQAGCETMTGAADCLDLRDGSTAGVTMVTLNNLAPLATLGAYTPTGSTIVDVGGAGTSAAAHFILDPASTGYVEDPVFGPAIDRPGLFRYVLRYDAANQRHAMVGLPRSEVLEYAILGGGAQSVWHMTAEAVTDRQTELRAGTEPGSVWLRAAGEYSKRDFSTPFTVFSDSFEYDNGYKLYAGTLLGGMDLIVGESGAFDYVIGGQVGYVGSSFELNASPSTGRFTGATGGFYGSVWSEVFFLDGAININALTLDYDSRGLNAKTNTYLNSIGGQAEGGARVRLTDRSFVEPLVSLAYVRTRFEEISLEGGEIKPSDAKSLRGALGVRLGATLSGDQANVSWFVAGRAWNQFEGESGGTIKNPGDDLAFSDELTGAFGEAEAGVNLFNGAGTLSGYLTTGVKFKDGYSATNLSLGVRMAW